MTKLVPDFSRLLGFKLAGPSDNCAVITGSKVGKIGTDISTVTGAKIGKSPSPGIRTDA